jgi:hypothetical protein
MKLAIQGSHQIRDTDLGMPGRFNPSQSIPITLHFETTQHFIWIR